MKVEGCPKWFAYQNWYTYYNKPERLSNPIATCFFLLLFILTVVFLVLLLTPVKHKVEAKTITTYKRPAAFRLASPTPEQMEHYHALLKVMKVNNANLSKM